MASLNHHPYLGEVLISLQKHQMSLESRAGGGGGRGGSDGGGGDDGMDDGAGIGVGAEHSTLFTELPWRNEAAEWAELDAGRRRAAAAQAHAQSQSQAQAQAAAEARNPFLEWGRAAAAGPARVLASLEGTFAVDGRGERAFVNGATGDAQWEDDSVQMKQALRMAGELRDGGSAETDAAAAAAAEAAAWHAAGAEAGETAGNEWGDTLPGNGKPITGPRGPPEKQARATCSMFSF